MPDVDRVGDYKATVAEYKLRQVESGAVSVSLLLNLTHILHEDKWFPWHKNEFTVWHDSWIVKRDGTVNQRAVDNLATIFPQWSGAVGDWGRPGMVLGPCRVSVKEEAYEGTTRFRADWLNAVDAPMTRGPVPLDDAGVKALEARCGAQFRALVGNVRRNVPLAAPEPAPVTSGPSEPQVPAPPTGDEIPF